MWKEASLAQFEVLPETCLEKLAEATKISQNNRSPGIGLIRLIHILSILHTKIELYSVEFLRNIGKWHALGSRTAHLSHV
jgi:hypothetical protein